jgi:hypothetical protein
MLLVQGMQLWLFYPASADVFLGCDVLECLGAPREVVCGELYL